MNQAQTSQQEAESRRQLPNLPLPTLRGAQIWADQLFFHDWHIQRNVITGHYRLVDGATVRHAWGTLEHCRDRLAAIRSERHLPPMQGRAVVVMHGMFRTHYPMRGIARYLATEGGYSVFNMTYPSNWRRLSFSADMLAKLLAGLEGIDEINFVCHSLGNIVVRHYLADCARGEYGGVADPRIHRMVMLGPPNQGSAMAHWLRAVDPLGFVVTARELRDWRNLQPRLATPKFEFAVIAGGRGVARGYNPFLRGDNDLIVTVESTRLAGARDFAVLPARHSVMMNHPTVRSYTLNFLREGFFESEANRRPIVA